MKGFIMIFKPGQTVRLKTLCELKRSAHSDLAFRLVYLGFLMQEKGIQGQLTVIVQEPGDEPNEPILKTRTPQGFTISFRAFCATLQN